MSFKLAGCLSHNSFLISLCVLQTGNIQYSSISTFTFDATHMLLEFTGLLLGTMIHLINSTYQWHIKEKQTQYSVIVQMDTVANNGAADTNIGPDALRF